MRHQATIRGLLISLAILGLILPSFNFILSEQTTPPDTPEEAIEMGKEVTEEAKENLPGILEKIWKEEILPFWKKTWNWTKDYWEDTLWPRIAELCSSLAQRFTRAIKGLWERKVKSPVEEEAEKRKEIIQEKVEEEKKEIEEKLKDLWK